MRARLVGGPAQKGLIVDIGGRAKDEIVWSFPILPDMPSHYWEAPKEPVELTMKVVHARFRRSCHVGEDLFLYHHISLTGDPKHN